MYTPSPPPINGSLDDIVQWVYSEFKQLSEDIAKLEERISALEGDS